jgi:2-methylisocitrate lyase-like PEP mutase family enzyme
VSRSADLRARFLALHEDPPAEPTPGILVMPNPWDVGSAKVLTTLGFCALATTSAGFAGSLGRHDQHITREELIDHVIALTSAVDVPFNVDAEDCFADDVAGVIETVSLLDATDAAGFSIEDYDPRADEIRSIEVATERVAAARSASADLVLTARAENRLHGIEDLDDTIARLIAYRDAGADVLYAPGLFQAEVIARVVEEVGAPVNVLALPGTPPIPELATLGVARISVGSLFAWTAYGALVEAASELMGPGTQDYVKHMLAGELRSAAFS